MKIKNVPVLVLSLAVMMCVMGMAFKADAAGKPWVLGVIAPLTGPYADESEDQVRSATLAMDELNAAGGILGREIKMVVEDNRMKPSITIQKTRKLIEEDGVHVLVGGVSSSCALARNAEVQKYNVLNFGMAGTNDATGKACHRHFLTANPSATQMASGAASVFFEKFPHLKKWFFITADYSWGHTCYEYASKAVEKRGGTVVGNILSPLGCPDFTPYLTKAMQSGADVVDGIVYGADQQKLLTQAYELGLKKKMKIVMSVGCQTANYACGPTVMEGVYVGLPWDWSVPYPNARAYAEKCLKRFGRPPAWSPSNVYTSVIVGFDAVRRAGKPPEDFNAELCIWLLEGHRYRVTKGWEEIRACDHRAIQEYFVAVGKNEKQMENKWDMFEIIGTLNGPELMRTCEEAGCTLEPFTQLEKEGVWSQ
jgi:ABC-type branched-subunit amino acid transport system substrate-binding protein